MIDTHRLKVARMAHLSWKARHRNGGYWAERWFTCNQKGCKWRVGLRWVSTLTRPPEPRRRRVSSPRIRRKIGL